MKKSDKQKWNEYKEKREIGGIVLGNVSNSSTNYFKDKHVSPRGHGFAAEEANHLADKLLGKNAQLVGHDLSANGADRIVDGIKIQSKYCSSGSKCIEECFDSNGRFRYMDNGKPMQIEVPSDKYDDAVKAMQSRIEKGKIPGVEDPNKAKEIVRKGHFTHKQSMNIAKAGTIESITFDAVNGAIIAGYAGGISSAIVFATAIWSGDDFSLALKKSIHAGLQTGGITFVTAVASAQISRSAVNAALLGNSEAIVQLMGPKASSYIVNACRTGKNIYGAAAMKSAAKMFRGNVVTGIISIGVMSAFDIVDIFRGRISLAQLAKNIAGSAASVGGGAVGLVGGSSVGIAVGGALGSIVPGAGTALGAWAGGIAGSCLGAIGGGCAANKAANVILDEFVDDDAKKMLEIVEAVFKEVVQDYILNRNETEILVGELQKTMDSNTLKLIYSKSNRRDFVYDYILSIADTSVLSKRKLVALPSNDQLLRGLRATLEEIADAEAA